MNCSWRGCLEGVYVEKEPCSRIAGIFLMTQAFYFYFFLAMYTDSYNLLSNAVFLFFCFTVTVLLKLQVSVRLIPYVCASFSCPSIGADYHLQHTPIPSFHYSKLQFVWFALRCKPLSFFREPCSATLRFATRDLFWQHRHIIVWFFFYLAVLLHKL